MKSEKYGRDCVRSIELNYFVDDILRRTDVPYWYTNRPVPSHPERN